MLANYWRIAWRNLVRNKGFTLINILGLCAGLTCFTLIALYVQSESGYDRFHTDSERIYRVGLERKYPGRSRFYATIPHSYAQAFEDEYSEVEASCRLFFLGNNTYLRQGDNIFEEDKILWADSTFFDFFGVPILSGDPEKLLSAPNSCVLTESAAIKYFGQDWANKQIEGQILDIVDNDNDMQVTGVCADIPEHSHLIGDFIRSSTAFNFRQQPNFINFFAYTYLKVAENADAQRIEAGFPQLVTKYASGQVLQNFGVDYAQYQRQGNGYRYFLQPLEGIYLDSNLEGEMKPPGSRSRIHFFVLIAILIIIIAAINFMNLSTAKSTNRAREVGIRKTLGSLRSQLVRQFLTESVLIALIAGVLALVLSSLLIPAFNDLTHKTFAWHDIVYWPFLLVFALLIIVSGLLSGIYPAFFMSAFSPLQAIRGKFISNTRGIGLRNGLVIFQFGISIFLIASTIMVYRQLAFTQNKALGFDKDSIVILKGTNDLDGIESETFKTEILKIPKVVSVGGCSNQPGETYPGTSFRAQGADETTTGSIIWIDEDYLSCMGMNVLDGRSFSREYDDSTSILINQAALDEMGLSDPIGKLVTTQDDFLNDDENNPTQYEIVGLIEDYHFQSLHHQITPLFFVHNSRNFNPGSNNQTSLRIKAEDWATTLSSVESVWKRFQPDKPFRHAFLDRQWASLYDQEITSRKVFSVFSLLAIFIACLGLLALANYITEQRLKEIGIRKVLGATVGGIVTMLSKSFLKLVIFAMIIAIPLAYYFLDNWLEGFAYRTAMSWWIFALAGILAIVIAAATVGYTSVRAAMINPIQSIKSE